MRIGVIAEEISDVEVLYELTCKLIDERDFSFKKFIGHGCGKLRRKCNSWAQNLVESGCKHLIILHDLDQNNEIKLRAGLNDSVKDVGFKGYVILIPIHAIEAWLLTDPDALKRAFRMRKRPTLPTAPETLSNPKKELRRIVWRSCKKHYINTIHNKRIAVLLKISKLKVCTSFGPYPTFISKYIPNRETISQVIDS